MEQNAKKKISCGGFMLGEGLVLSEDGKTLSVSSGGGGDVYLIKHITNAETGAQELQGDYAGALAAFESGESLKFVEAFIVDGEELVYCESFSYAYSPGLSQFSFAGYNGTNFITYILTESGITSSGNGTHVQSLYVDSPGRLYLKSSGGANKVFRIKVSDTGELSTEEVT